jgi:hypothetical protein
VLRFWEVYFFWLNVKIARIRLAKENIAIKVSKTVKGITPFLRGKPTTLEIWLLLLKYNITLSKTRTSVLFLVKIRAKILDGMISSSIRQVQSVFNLGLPGSQSGLFIEAASATLDK